MADPGHMAVAGDPPRRSISTAVDVKAKSGLGEGGKRTLTKRPLTL